MAFEGILTLVPGARAAADLSTHQYKCVFKNATDLQYALCTTDGQVFDGVLQDDPNAAGVEARVAIAGVTRVIAGEAMAAGDRWGTDSAGLAKIVKSTNTGADTTDFIMGVVLKGGGANSRITVVFGPSFKVET